MRVRPQTVLLGHLALLAGAMAVAVLSTQPADWQPVGLLVALTALAVGSDLLALNLRNMQVSASFAAIITAAVLLGTAPAMFVGLAPIVVDALRRRPSRLKLIANLAAYATFPVAAGLAVDVIDVERLSGVWFVGTVMAIFVAANALNFCVIYSVQALTAGWSWLRGLRDYYAPVMPAQLGIGVVTVAIIWGERQLGAEVIVVLAPIVLVCQWLLRIAISAFERGEELEQRNQQLAALQFGLISTTMKTLALRDHMTARHSAAVARYAREMAAALGLSSEEQELFHTAGLFHDIGKFIFPDSILLASKGLTEEEFAIVRQHPEVGADLIAEIEGYGPVADIVRHHHERVDGRGYPFGLHADLIPLGSRVLAVADVYDVLTARDTYRDPVSTSEAFDELRRSAGTQLDARLVEVFIELVSRRGLMFSHSSAEDFEAELALERRVSDYAAPKPKVAA